MRNLTVTGIVNGSGTGIAMQDSGSMIIAGNCEAKALVRVTVTIAVSESTDVRNETGAAASGGARNPDTAAARRLPNSIAGLVTIGEGGTALAMPVKVSAEA
jgi:hypothetical protein